MTGAAAGLDTGNRERGSLPLSKSQGECAVLQAHYGHQGVLADAQGRTEGNVY